MGSIPIARLLLILFFAGSASVADAPVESQVPPVRTVMERKAEIARGEIRAIHLTGSAAASKKYREKLKKMLDQTILNGVIIDIKEETGYIYIPGVSTAEKAGAYQRTMGDWKEWLAQLESEGVYAAARIVVNKDNIYPRKNLAAAVKNTHGEIWFDRTKTTWMDPYSNEAQRYNLLVALEAAKLGFDEIQFDYIRFPTDGSLNMMRFSQTFNKRTSAAAIVEFLMKAKQLLQPMGVKLSIDVFGLTTTGSGMGIGQDMAAMSEQVDFVCPMVYPSHYNPGEYGLAIPNDAPYETITFAMREAKKMLGGVSKLRPYLQDFSLKGRGKRYAAKEVRAQIQASADQGIVGWTLWNARCSYTLDALRDPVTPNLDPPSTELQNNR